MPDDADMFVFPRWSNYLLPAALILIVGAGLYAPFLLAVGGSPRTTDVGYAPEQPIPFSHELHVGQLHMDCRYCHHGVADAAAAGLPSTQTCMNCHATILGDSALLQPLRDSHETGMSIPWRKVHDLPDHAYFDHSVHVSKGVGCVTCHGPVHEMPVMRQHATLSMAWCLDCHRDPGPNLRPRAAVTQTDWDRLPRSDQEKSDLARRLMREHRIDDRASMESCSRCHR